MSNPFEGMPGLDESTSSAGADPFAGMPGNNDPIAGMPGESVSDNPASKFVGMLSDPDKGAAIQRLAKSWGIKTTDPAVQARLTEPMGFRTYSTLMQLAATGDTDEASGLDKNGKPTGLGLRAALIQFGHAGGAFRRRDAAITSRIAAGQELEVGDTRPFNQQIATGMAGMPAPNMRTFKKIEDMSRAEQDASVPKDVLDVVNQYDSPSAPLDAKTRAQKIYDLAQASAMSREQVKRDAAEELAIREELTGKSDGLVNTIGNLAAKGMPTVGYGNSFLVGSWVLGGAVSGMDKASELLAADIDPETGKVLKAGDTYGEARLKGYGYGAFEGLSEVYTGKILGTALKGLDKVTGGYVGKTLSKGLDKAAQGLAKTSIGRGIAEFGKGVQRMAGLSALDNPAVEILGEEAEQQWAETAFAQRASDTTAPVYAKNVFNEATGQIEQVPIEPGSEEEATAKRQIAHYGDKSEYSQAGVRQLTVGEKTKQYANDFYTWDNMGAMAEGFALQYALTLGGGAIHAIKNKDTRQAIDRALLMSGANNADLARMSDEQKAEAFEKYYGSKENQAEFAEVFKDAGEQLSDMAQRMQDTRIWEQTGNSLKPNFQTDLAKTLVAGTPAVDDEASGLTVSQTVSPEGTPAFTVQDRDGVLNPVTVASVAEAQKAAERMSQMKQGRDADMQNRAAIATRVAQTFAPGRKLVLVQSDKDMLPAAEAAYAEEGSPFDPAQVKSSAKGATTPKGQTIIVNVAAATGVPDLVETIGHETGHSAFTQAGLTDLMQGKGASHLADEFQKAGVIAKGAEGKALFLSDVAKLKDSYASQGVKLNEAAAVEEVLANMNQGMTPVMRKRFGGSLRILIAKKIGGPDSITDATRIAAQILHSGKGADVHMFGGPDAWSVQPAFTGDPLAEEGEKAAAPAPAETPAPVPVEASAPAAEPVAPAPQAQEEVKLVAPKEKKVFNSEEDFIAYASEHEDEVKDWTQDVDFEIKPQTEKEAQNAVQKPGAGEVDVRQQAGTGEEVGKGNAEGQEAPRESERAESQPPVAEAKKPGLTLEGGTAADIEADKAKVEAQQQKQKEREEIEAKAAAPIKGDLGEMTAVLPGMEDTDEIPLLNQPKTKPKAEESSADVAPFEVEGLKFNGIQRLPGMPDQQVWSDTETKGTFFMPAGATRAEVEEHAAKSRAKFEAAKPAAVAPSAVAPKNAEVEFERPVLKDQYAEIPGVSVGGKRTYLEKKRGSLKTYRVSDQHEGKVLNGMAVLLRTKGKSYQIEGIRIVGGGAMPAGSENWTVTGWEAYNRDLAAGAQEAPKTEVKPVETPAPKSSMSQDELRTTMIAMSLKWQGAHRQAEQILLGANDRRGAMKVAMSSGKSDNDEYLMRKFGVDRDTAHAVNNHITQQNLAYDKHADVSEFAGEDWADSALAARAKAEPPKVPKKPRTKFASQADFESYVLANPDKLEELERVGYEIEQAEAPVEAPAEAAPAPVEAKKPEFVPPLKGLTEAPQIYKRRVEKLRKEWEAAQAEQPAEAPKEEASVAPKEAEEIEEARMNAETQARVRAIPAKEYAAAPALAAIKAELPAYEARKASKVRTADSMERQAYSTPPPLAAIGAEAAQDAATIVEPTAGNGGLLAPLALNVLMPNAPIKWTRNTLIGETKRARILANELDTGRADRLGKFLAESMNVTDPVFSGDYASAKYQTAVSDAKSDGKRAFLMNPPFGGADESGYKLEHRIALKTIESAVPGDTLFFIGGAPSRDAMKLPTGALAGFYTSGAFAKFHEELNRQGWAPSLHFIADGALYKKMGAAYPVEVLLMEKTATPGQHRPMRDLPARYSTWDQILAAVENMYDPGAETTPELLALDLTATPEREEAKRAEANTFAESLPKALQNEREREIPASTIRYRLSLADNPVVAHPGSLQESDLLPLSALRAAMYAPYATGASSRETPVPDYDAKVGGWYVDDTLTGAHGRDIDQLLLLNPATLTPNERMVWRNEEGRGWDSEKYRVWSDEGKIPPPIRVLETENGQLLVTDGHRRFAAALAAGRPVLALVSPAAPTPSLARESFSKRLIATSLTTEIAQKQLQGTLPEWKDETWAERVKPFLWHTQTAMMQADNSPRYRLSQDIELGMVTPVTDTKVPQAFLNVYRKAWDGAFLGKVFNPSQLAERIVSMPPDIGAAYIKVADAIADYLKAQPGNVFSVSPDYSSMGIPLREAFKAKWDAARPTTVELEEGKAQVPYSTMSGVDVVSPMMVPRDLGMAVSVANGNFLDRHPEGVDEYVATKMGWTMAQVTDGRLDGSQLDTLAMAIEKIDAGSGYIVGSQTGAGKGRIMAAITAYHLKNGRMPVFLTAKANLFTAMWEDIKAIGEEKLFKPLVMNNYKAPGVDENDPDAEDADGFLMPQFFTPVQRNAALSEGKMPKTATALFLTYSQVQTNNQKKIDLISRILSNGGALVMDEAHLAAGADSNTGVILRQLADLPKAGVVFSSATFAKRGENMTLYKRAGYSQFFENDQQMEAVLAAGGVPFQQFLAARLTEQGYYIRHELDYTGIVFEKILTTDTLGTPAERTVLANREEQIADVYNQVIRTVMRFAGAVKRVNSRLQKGAPGAHMDGEAFMSSLHNTASFIYTALKAETVAKAAVKALREGRAPVISLYNTNQALLEEIGEGNKADVGRYLMRIAERSIALQTPDGSSVSILTPEGHDYLVSIVKEADAEMLVNAAHALMEQAKSAAEYLREQNLPASPIDRVKDIVEEAGFKFAELTGRSLAVDKYGAIVSRKRPSADDVVYGFNNSVTEDGKPNTVLLLNSAGATGLSIHNSPKFKNRATREMFVLQPAWDINEMMQMFGRVNRKDQLTKPIYHLMFTSAAGEQRNAAILMLKLRSLSANTSGVSKAGYGESAEDALDFMNTFGDKALAELEKEKNPTVSLINDLRQSSTIRRATSISQFLPVADQAEFIAQIQARVAALQEHARESGAHDLEAGDIGRVPLAEEHLSMSGAMRAYEVPVTGKAKILTAGEAIAQAKEWQEKHPELLETALAKIEKAKKATENPWLHRIYGITAQTLKKAVDSIGQVYRSDATATSERSHFIPVAIYLPPSGTAQTVSDWRVKVSFNNIRGTTTLPLSIFYTRLLAPASYSYDYVYNQNLTRKEDRTLITGDIAKALIGSIDAAGMTGGGVPRIVRATPGDGNFSSFVLMMPRGISVANAKKIVSVRREPLTDVRKVAIDRNGRPVPVEIDAGRVRVHATVSNGEIAGAFFSFRSAVPMRAKSRELSIASIIRATGLGLLGTAPNKAGYIEGSPVNVERANKILADLAKLSPALQATRLVSDEASVGGQAATAEAPRYRFAPVASKTDSIGRMPDMKLRRYLVSSLGYGEAEVAGLGRQEMLRLALNADSDPYFQSPRYRLSEPVQVGELRTQSELERLAPDGTFPILEHLRGGSKIMVPIIIKGSEYDWLKAIGGVSAFDLTAREAFFTRPGEGDKRTKGNIDSIAKELGYDDVNEFADAFLAEWQKSRDLYAVEKARQQRRSAALAAAREKFTAVKEKKLMGAIMGRAIDEVANTLPDDIKADVARLGSFEGDEGVRDFILARYFEDVIRSMQELYSYEGRDDTQPPEVQDEGTLSAPEIVNRKAGEIRQTYKQTKDRLEEIVGKIWAPPLEVGPKITDADAKAFVDQLVDLEGVDTVKLAVQKMIAERLGGQRTTPLTKYETAMMLWYQVQIDKDAQTAVSHNDIRSLEQLDLLQNKHNNDTLEYAEAQRKYGRAAGQSLQALQMRVDRGFNLVKIYRQAVKDNGDIALTPERYAKLRDRVARLEKAWNDYVDAKGMTEEGKDLEARVGALEAEIANLTGAETGLKADIGAIEAKRNELELQRAELATGLSALSERKARIEADIARVESEIAFRISLAQEVETLQKRLGALNAKLTALDAEYASVDTDRLAALEAEIAKLEAEYGKKQSDYEEASAALKVAEERLARIRKLMEKLGKNTKSKIQRRREVQQHASNLYGVFKAEMAKVQLEQMADRWRGANPLGKVWIGVGMTRNVIRALQSMGDVSIAGRQLAKLGLGHPILWAKALAESRKLVVSLVGPTDANGRLLTLAERSDRALFEMDQMLREHPLWQVLRKGGLDWIDLTADPTSFDEQQVPVSAFLRAYLPKWTGVGTATTLLDISNNHYAGMSNMLRFYVAAQLYEKMQVANGGMAPSEADVRAIVTTVDIFGGRGDITTDKARSAIKVMSNILYSPRLAVANVQFYGRFVGIAGNWSYSRKARQMIAMEYLRTLGMYAVFSVIARLISKMFSDDPNEQRFQSKAGHTAFGEFMFGQRRVGITGGSEVWARYAIATAPAFFNLGGYGVSRNKLSTETGLVLEERPRFDPNAIWRLFRSKVEPLAGATIDLVSGETYDHQAAGPLSTPDQPGYSSRYRNILGDIMPIPLTAQTVASLIKGDAEQGIEPMRNPLVLLPTIGLEMLGVLSSSLPVNSQLAQEVEAGYTHNAEKLEKLEREQKDILLDKTLSPDLKEIRAGLIQTKIDAVRGTP